MRAYAAPLSQHMASGSVHHRASELEKGIVARNDFKEGEGNTEPPKTAATNLRIFLEYQESDTLLICEVLKSIRI